MGPRAGAVADRFGGRRELELDVRLQLLVVTELLEGFARRARAPSERHGCDTGPGRGTAVPRRAADPADVAATTSSRHAAALPSSPASKANWPAWIVRWMRALGWSSGVSSRARSANWAAASGAPRPLACRDAASSSAATRSSGRSVESARCRARSSWSNHHRCEPPMNLPPLVPRRHRVLNGREQRVGRPDASGARLDHTVVESSLDVLFGIRASDRLRDQRSGGLRRGRRDQEHVPDRIGQPGQPIGDQVDERRRHRKRAAGVSVDPPPKQGAPELQCEEGIPGRRCMDLEDHSAREPRRELRIQEVAGRLHRDRTDKQSMDPFVR